MVASDLEEEAPLYWLRVKQAAERGATLIVANPRHTKTDRYADLKIRYSYGQEAAAVMALLSTLSPKRPDLSDAVKELVRDAVVKEAAKAFAEAENAVVFFGSEGTGLEGSAGLAKACANLLVATGHTGKANNGLVGVWDKGNVQGGWDMGLQPSAALADELKSAKVAYLVAADPAGDDPALKQALQAAEFVVVQELHHTASMELADVVLPAQSLTEREGTTTNGERRVQRYYPAVPPPEGTKADFAITAEIAAQMGKELQSASAGMVFFDIVAKFADYADLDYQILAEVQEQWPIIGREDLYYGGTGYANQQGLGVQLNTAAGRGEPVSLEIFDLPAETGTDGLLAVPVNRLYDQGNTMRYARFLFPRIDEPFVVVSGADAAALNLNGSAKIDLNGFSAEVDVKIDENLPQGVVLVPRSFGLPLHAPAPITVKN